MNPDTAELRQLANARVRAWYRAHPEAARVQLQAWRKANPEKVRAQNARRAVKKKAWAKANPDVGKTAERNWRTNNKDKRNAITAARYARKRGLTPPLTAEDKARVLAFYTLARAMTDLAGEPYHVDHKTALANGGLHHPDNLQVLRGVDNQRKGTK